MENKSYKEYLSQINTLVFDVDGVFTDGSLQLTADNQLIRTFNVKDGYAVLRAIEAGLNICIITGGNDLAVKQQFKNLGVKDVYLKCVDKKKQLEEYLDIHHISTENVLYMGDDIPDLYPMEIVKLACSPQDAVQEIKKVSHYVSHKLGGKGCVRDIIEQVLKMKGKWNV